MIYHQINHLRSLPLHHSRPKKACRGNVNATSGLRSRNSMPLPRSKNVVETSFSRQPKKDALDINCRNGSNRKNISFDCRRNLVVSAFQIKIILTHFTLVVLSNLSRTKTKTFAGCWSQVAIPGIGHNAVAMVSRTSVCSIGSI